MWYTVLITLVIDVGGLLLLYALLRDRIRRATSAAAQIAELREEVSRLVVELNQTTERNVALLEDRVSGLGELLTAADRKMALLQREIEKHDVGTRVYSRLVEGNVRAAPGSARAAQIGTQAVPGGPHGAQAGMQDSQGIRGPEPAAAAQQPLSVELSDRPGAEAASQRQDMRQRVVMLSRSGFSAALIAARVGVPLGEVELIISLERQRMAQPGQDEGSW